MSRIWSRRALVAGGITGATALMGGLPTAALAGPASISERRFVARNVNTGDRCDALLMRAGARVADGWREIDHFFRDWRAGATRSIDPDLVTLLLDVRETLGAESRPFELICGYRAPATNARRHAQSSGVAKQSLHMVGKAADVRITGVSLSRLAAAGHAKGRGGVGFYPRDGFVHLDTGPVRSWQG